MTEIGQFNNRQIFYVNIRTESNWFNKLPTSNWLAFTIANSDDKELLHEMTIKSLDKNVLYICSVGELASLTDDYFDEEIVWRQVQLEEQTGKPQDYEASPMTTFHRNFDEGFWFAIQSAYAIAYDEYIPIDKVVCIDMTQRGVKQHIIKLLHKIQNNWRPSDNEVEVPVYDT